MIISHGLRFFGLATAAALLVASPPTPLLAAQPTRILVTNDDGWSSPALAAVVLELSTIGQVAVAAPSGNRSGSSQSLGSIAAPFRVEPVEVPGATQAWSVDATPAGAAAFGLIQLRLADQPFDIVVSGINRGENVGELSHVSGTVGAAMQAASMGVPAIAVSQGATARDYGFAAKLTAKLVGRVLAARMPAGLVLSVNVPAAATTGEPRVVVRPMGGATIALDGFAEVSTDGAAATWRIVPRLVKEGAPEGSDTEAFLEGAITITPLRFDWTDQDRLDWTRQLLAEP